MININLLKLFILIIISIFLWSIGVLFGENLGGDFRTYEQDFTAREIGDILYSYSRDIARIIGLNFIAYHFIICMLQSIIICRLLIKFKYNIFTSVIVLTYLMSVGWIGHFRATFTIFSLLFIFLSTRFFIITLLAHFGNWINLTTFLMLRKKIFILILGILLTFFVLNPNYFHFIFEYFDRERFFISYTSSNEDLHHEHRNLWTVDNLKLVMSISIILITIKFGIDYRKYFILIPYSSYVFFGFDAYTAQKAFLNFSFFSFLGFYSLGKNLLSYLCKFLILFDLLHGVYTRWQVYL